LPYLPGTYHSGGAGPKRPSLQLYLSKLRSGLSAPGKEDDPSCFSPCNATDNNSPSYPSPCAAAAASGPKVQAASGGLFRQKLAACSGASQQHANREIGTWRRSRDAASMASTGSVDQGKARPGAGGPGAEPCRKGEPEVKSSPLSSSFGDAVDKARWSTSFDEVGLLSKSCMCAYCECVCVVVCSCVCRRVGGTHTGAAAAAAAAAAATSVCTIMMINMG